MGRDSEIDAWEVTADDWQWVDVIEEREGGIGEEGWVDMNGIFVGPLFDE